MAKAVHGRREVDTSIQCVLRQMSEEIKDKSIQLDADTVLALLEFASTALTVGLKTIKVRIAQVKSGHDTTEKKLEKKLKK